MKMIITCCLVLSEAALTHTLHRGRWQWEHVITIPGPNVLLPHSEHTGWWLDVAALFSASWLPLSLSLPVLPRSEDVGDWNILVWAWDVRVWAGDLSVWTWDLISVEAWDVLSCAWDVLACAWDDDGLTDGGCDCRFCLTGPGAFWETFPDDCGTTGAFAGVSSACPKSFSMFL